MNLFQWLDHLDVLSVLKIKIILKIWMWTPALYYVKRTWTKVIWEMILPLTGLCFAYNF